MGNFKVIIQKSYVADDAQPIGKDGKFIGITEMPVDVLLFGIRAGNSMRGHEPISHLIRINIRIIFVVNFQFANKSIEGGVVVFRNIKFDARGVKGKDLSQGGIDLLTEGFCIIDHLLKHEFNVVGKAQFKACKQRCIRDFGKTTELSKFFTEIQ